MLRSFTLLSTLLLGVLAASPAQAQWTLASEGAYLTLTESVTLPNASVSYSSEITVIPASRGFAFTLAVPNTSGNITVDVEASINGDDWFVAANDVAALDNASSVEVYVPSTSGAFPYYRLSFTSAGDDDALAATVVLAVDRTF